jgi:leader peptidase (prepilin peptidase)/N-methyltransferase
MAAPELIAVAAAYGLVLGSFLNVVVHRVPRQMSLLKPRSHCPACGQLIRWYDNIPVLSWLLLRGRCRHCGARISVRYPAVELASALLLAAVVARFGLTVPGAAAVVLGALLLALALIDLEHFLLPDVLTLPGIAAGLCFSLAGGLVRPVDAVIGAVVGAALPYAVIVLYRLVRGVEGMGQGDVKLLAMIGAFLGWQGALLTLCVGACVGALVGIALVLAGRGKADTELPFGTFLSAAALLVLFARAPLLALLGWGRW